MWLCGQYFNRGIIDRIQATVESEPEISRRALSRQICEWLEWRSINGKLKEMSCRKALQALHRRGRITLPEQKKSYSFQRPKTGIKQDSPLVDEICCNLKELGKVEIAPITSRYSKASRQWNQLLDSYHYLGSGPLCGAQIRYLVHSEIHGLLGGLSFSASTWKLKARDECIGWSERARRQNLQRVVCNSRFLIIPTVRVANLASHVLSQCLNRLAVDWQERYGYAPVLVETFVDSDQYTGASYRAANWTRVGETAGRADGYANGKVSDGKKQIYVYPLRKGWRSRLCRESKPGMGELPRPEAPQDWAEEEFASVELFDERLKERLLVIARDFYAQPGELVPQACGGSAAKVKATYRFFDNRNTDMQGLLQAHIGTTIDRIQEYEVVLAVQDTTTLSYTAHASKDMGPINARWNSAMGLMMHDTLAFTEDGVPLGLLDVQCWSRKPEEAGKGALRHQLPIEQKESMKWLKSYRAVEQAQQLCPETMLVSVGDREADIYELFEEATGGNSKPKLLVRAMRGRNRTVEQIELWEKLSQQPVSGIQEVRVPRKGNRRARTAKLAVRFSEIRLDPPKTKNSIPVTMWAVFAQEIDPGEDVETPIEWMLLTTVATDTFEDACKRIAWYSKRWGIEVYHRTVKSGCRIEDRRLGSTDRLEACLAIDFVVAWRIYWLTKQGRETPNIPCDVFLNEDEWQVLWAYVKKEPPPAEPPPIGQITPLIASLGGYLNRNGDGPPGTTTMWRGLIRLHAMAEGFSLCKTQMQRDGP
jgi:Druantia protein DruA/Transposase DNA-binding/Transposase Tn5 dimerisation domain